MLERCDERELDALALLVAGLRSGEPVVEAQLLVGIGLDPGRLDKWLTEWLVRITGRAVVDRQHAPRSALEDPQADVGRDRVEPRTQGASALKRRQASPRSQQ